MAQQSEMGRTSVRYGMATLRSGAAVLSLALATVIPAFAQAPAEDSASEIKIELNRLEPAGESCRTFLLVDNRGPALKSLKTDLFAFDTDGIAQKRLAVELGPITEKKTMVRLFEIQGLACPKIGRLLLNDVLACDGADVTRESCLSRIKTSSKAGVELAR